jgi:hypothetical protein
MQSVVIAFTLFGSLGSALIIQKMLLQACFFAIDPNRGDPNRRRRE